MRQAQHRCARQRRAAAARACDRAPLGRCRLAEADLGGGAAAAARQGRARALHQGDPAKVLVRVQKWLPPPANSTVMPAASAKRTRTRDTMTFRIAVVQPIAHRPGEDENNIADAVAYVERAAAQGAHFVCLPE